MLTATRIDLQILKIKDFLLQSRTKAQIPKSSLSSYHPWMQ